VLLCPYHHWSFELDGRMKGCAEMHEADGFTTELYRLREFRSEVWEGFVFVNLDGKAETLSARLSPLRECVSPFQMGRLKVVIEDAWDCPFNWKVMIENWMESYHHLGIHHDTLQTFMPAKDTWTEKERPHFVRSHLPIKPSIVAEAGLDAPGKKSALDVFEPIPGVAARERAEWAIHVGYPCFMFGVASDRVLWYRLEPLAADRCRLLTTVLVAPEAKESPDFVDALRSETEMLREFHRQDMQVCTAVQRGLSSSSYVRGPLSHLEMPVWLIQRYVAARGRGTWPTLDAPAALGQRTA
jgi:phenylpropionate dioxygenase-like ring-hydroxylating dioxygenase large terminal subunit